MKLFSRKTSRPSINSDTATIGSNGSRKSSITTLRSPTRDSDRAPQSPMLPTIPSRPLSQAPNPSVNPAGYLRSIHAVRERCQLVFNRALTNRLTHFDVDMSKFPETAAYVVSIIKRDYAPDYASIPAHGRWQHFDVGGRPRIDQLLGSWPSSVNQQERTRRLIDLFLVSVLLDAGAGAGWQYKSKQSGRIYRRSEGLAVASLEMFTAGLFSGDPSEPHQVDAVGLRKLSVGGLGRALQVSEDNPISGLAGRAGLLMRLGDALENSKYFGADARPGNMLDYLMNHHSTQMSSVPIIALPTFWNLLMDGLAPIWPESRTQIGGVSLGDAWPCSSMPSSPPGEPWETVVPFHKLTQWLTYSLMGPMSRLMKIRFSGEDLMTGLPEYRNGGLLIDTGLLTLKQDDYDRGVAAYNANARKIGQPKVEVVPLFTADDDVIVEWRALTVGFLDELLTEVNKLLGLNSDDGLTLAQMLEAGTWKASMPDPSSPPAMI
ncbi:MAG: hypothetical protein M1832_002773 [Thelocarpon impressellum]|nr:MAG: hypothetical protein M1832_002773 [Thelocarpon impressellum]